MSTPDVSVILPFRNGADTLPDCLASIGLQTHADFELLAIDDGSEDESAAIVRARAAGDPRVRLLSPGRVGLVAALNLGIAEARGPLIARLDADDLMHPERLAAQRDELMRRDDLALVASQVELFPAEQVRAGYREYVRWQNQLISPAEIANNIYVESPFAHPSVMLRHAVFDHVGCYADGPFPEDYELWLRMHAAGLRMAKLPRVLLAWREGPARASRVDPRYAREAFDMLRARFLACDPRLLAGRPIAIWGAGRRTRLRARRLIERGVAPVAWVDIDTDKIGHVVWGVPVQPPEWLDQRPRPFVLIYLTAHGAREIAAARLDGWGYRAGQDYLPVG
jgi:glycosyltransferase involved in cell wall biosynthesis